VTRKKEHPLKLGRLAQRAKQVIDQRGGSDALKKDADELRDIARGGGSLQDKAKKAAQALKEPGAAGAPAPTDTPPPPTPAPPREQAPTDTPEGPPPR
jgi:hypothetical protein